MSAVSRETLEKLAHFKALVIDENQRQNLVSPASIADFDRRHLEDGMQLAALGKPGSWCDVGSGAGLPGIVIAIITGAPMTLIEPRKLRADFLRRAVAELGIDARVAERRKDSVGRLPIALAIEQLPVRQVERARHMAPRHARPRIAFRAREARRRSAAMSRRLLAG